MKDIINNEEATSGFTYFLGLLIGGAVGFLLRPTAPLTGQLPLETVLLRGTNLQGFESYLTPYAETSFNYMAASALIGFFIILVVDKLSSKSSEQN
jgi:hypothetical protein